MERIEGVAGLRPVGWAGRALKMAARVRDRLLGSSASRPAHRRWRSAPESQTRSTESEAQSPGVRGAEPRSQRPGTPRGPAVHPGRSRRTRCPLRKCSGGIGDEPAVLFLCARCARPRPVPFTGAQRRPGGIPAALFTRTFYARNEPCLALHVRAFVCPFNYCVGITFTFSDASQCQP